MSKREIKCRIWLPHLNKIQYLNNFSWKNDGVAFSSSKYLDFGNIQNNSEYKDNTSDCVLMFYTGLKDSKDQEIWELDIVKFQYFQEEKIGRIIYSQAIGGFQIEIVENDISFLYPMSYVINSGEVIGNIFTKKR
jgi:uncharacterized phage protein (TIGR01671 family)